jgi:TPR repeat protein
MYEDGEGIPESDSLAASWYRKAADHFPEDLMGSGGAWEAEVQLTYMYREGRLPKDDVQAYMWLAIVGASVDPPDDDVKNLARHMTRAQIVQAHRLAEDWVKRHRRQRPTIGDNSPDHAQLAK